LLSSLLVTDAVGPAAGRAAAAPIPWAPPVCRVTATYTDCSPPTGWNGRRVFLSVACHDRGTGACHDNAGCGGFSENDNSLVIAEQATWGIAHIGFPNLLDRGYQVRIGTGLLGENIANSNAWVHDPAKYLHVPLHSNATAGPACVSDDSAAQYAGTNLLYRTENQRQAAVAMLAAVGPGSPGVHDQLVLRDDLGELNRIVGVTAYVETEYHTWGPGVAWLNDAPHWAWRIADGADLCFGFPRVWAVTSPPACAWAAATL
jgi:hypothetical protein